MILNVNEIVEKKMRELESKRKVIDRLVGGVARVHRGREREGLAALKGEAGLVQADAGHRLNNRDPAGGTAVAADDQSRRRRLP